MIQEPQGPEIIEIPIVESMNTNETNSLKNFTRNKNQSILNNKNRPTLIQIPKQNSKPRIFLLTRPAKPQLVPINIQSEQHRHEKNLLPHQHPQKTATNIASPRQSKIIRIPFLPRSQVQTFSVKSNQVNQVRKKDPIGVPIEVNLYPNQNRNTVQASQLEIPKQNSILAQTEAVQYLIAQQVTTNQLSPISTETSNQLQTQQSVKSTIPQKTVINNRLNLSENKTIQTPLTLASMAGIELTGADMSLSQADMSGAMPPTATVEEINVPVFIDEYLQQATISTTSVSTTNNNIHYNSNNNNYNNNQSNGKGNEVNNGLDTFENFEFDIDLLTENISKDEKEYKEFQVLEQQQEYLQQNQQVQLAEVDDDTNLLYNKAQQQDSMNIGDFKKQKQQQSQLMLEDLLFNNDNNSCKANNNIIINTISTTTTNNNSNNNTNNMAFLPKEDIDDLRCEESLLNDFFSQSDEKVLLGTDFFSFNSDSFCEEEAVDFNNCRNELSLNEYLIGSHSNQVMFSTGINSSQSALADISQEISEAEPTIPPERIHYEDSYFPNITATTSSAVQPSSCEISANDDICFSQIFDGLTMDGKLLGNPLKRSGNQTSKHMEEKRLKLRLDTKRCTEMDLPQKSDLSTPNIIKSILQNDDESLDNMGPADNSINSIYYELISTSPQSVSVKSEIIVDDVTNDISSPNTPYSVTSISNQTNFTGLMNTAPNSPASSIATTTNTSVTNKRGRGRPAKSHSDIPDISQFQHLSETEQKKMLERIKNNEASRKSRLKHKERENDIEKEENELLLKNKQLEMELKSLRKKELKLRKALEVQHFQLKNKQ